MEIYIDKDNVEFLKRAQNLYKKSIEIFHALNRPDAEAHARNSLAGSYLYSGELRKATGEVKESIKLGQEYKNDTSILINGYYTLATLHEMDGDAFGAKKLLELL